MKRYLLLSVLLMLILHGCAKRTDIKTSGKGAVLSGWIFNVETAGPIEETKITLMSDNDTVSVNSPKGKYYFDLSLGDYTLLIEKEGFVSQEKKLHLTEKKDYSHDFILLKKRELTATEKAAQEYLMNGITAFNAGEIKKAKEQLIVADRLTPDNDMIKEYLTKVNEKISILVDSLYLKALSLEVNKKNKDAAKIYETILSYDPDYKNVKGKLYELNKILTAKPEPKPEPKPTVNVENIYQQGLSLYSQGKYKSAIAKFNTVLRYKPNHAGARTHLKKAQNRLKALGG